MKNLYLFAKVLLVCLFWLVGFEGIAQSRYWVGGAGNWSDSQHWALESGGIGGALVPSSSDIVIVDRNSFDTNGVIVLSQDVSIKDFVWSDDAKNSGLSGNASITVYGNILFGSKNSLGWKGTLLPSSPSPSFLKITTPISANVIFSANAKYDVTRPINTKGSIVVNGNDVDFHKNIVKAKQITASDAVKSTMTSGFLKATQSEDNFFQVEFVSSPESCPGKADGSIKITTVTGGVPNSYVDPHWLYANGTSIAGATGMELKNATLGSYFFVISGVSPVTGNLVNDSFFLQVSGTVPLSFKSVTPVDATCNGNSGSINVSASFGVNPYTYYLNDVAFGVVSPIVNVPAGSYDLKIVDKKGCAYPYPTKVEVKQPDPIVLTTTTNPVTGCFGNANGTITATATGGVGSLEYSIDGVKFSATATFGSLAAGNYTITVRSSVDHSCIKTALVTISQPVKLAATVVANPVTGCSATPDGQIVISAAKGGSGFFEYSINGGVDWAPTGTFTALSVGSYNVMIRDLQNPTCLQTINAALQITAKPTLTATVTSTNVTCNGANDGIITITNPQGGLGTYEYSVVAGIWAGSGIFKGLAPNTYTVQIRDKANPGCFKVISSVTITQQGALSATVGSNNVTGCYNAANGTISITSSLGGSGQYEYSITGTTWFASPTFADVAAGTYAVSMRDKLNALCIKPLGSVTITAPVQITSTFTSVNVTGCAGNPTGKITFTATAGGSGQYDFSIDNGATWLPTPAFTGLIAKKYTLVVRDKLTTSCTSSIGVVNITEPAPLAATVTTSNVACFGTSTGTITVSSPTGGSGAFEYSRDGVAWQSNGLFTALPAAIYQVSIRDAGNKPCVKLLGSYTISQNPSLTATVTVTNVSGCFGTANGAINITNPQGGGGTFEYSKDGTTWVGSGSFTNLGAASFPIFIRDVANKTCSVKLGDYTVTQPANISITTITTLDPTCFNDKNGSITVNATGGTSPLTYSIGGAFQSPNLFSTLAAGSFTVTVKDNVGCTKQSDVTLNAPQKVVPTVTKKDVSCAGVNTGQIDITGVVGGVAPYQYSIQGGATGTYFPTSAFATLIAGTYNVRVKDAKGCESDIIPIVVKGSVVLDVIATPVSVTPCSGDKSGAINLTFNSGTVPYQYNIGAGNVPLVGTSISGLGAGNYNLIITDGAGCVKNLGNVAVVEPAPIVVTKITVTNVTGCTAIPNGSVFIQAGGGVTPLSYSADNGVTFGASNTITGLAAGDYTIKVKDANGCVFTVPGKTTITAPNKLVLDIVQTNASIIPVKCKGGGDGSVTVIATGGVAPLAYTISSGIAPVGSTFSGLAAGLYTVHVTDNGGCTQSAPVSITEPNVILPHLQLVNVSCNGKNDGRILVAPTGGMPNYTVTLTPAATFTSGAFSNLAAGNYTVKVVDANNCPINVPANITQPTPISITAQNFTSPTCIAGGTVTVTASGGTPPLKYSLMQGAAAIAANATGSFASVAGGVYTVDVTDVNSCTKASSLPMTLLSPSAIVFTNIVAPAIGCNGGTSSISLKASGVTGVPTVTLMKGGVATIPAPTVTANGAAYDISAANLTGGSYVVTVTDSNNPTCSQSQTIDISESAALVLGVPTVNPPTAGNNGSISVVATGGKQPYSFRLMPGNVVNNTGIFSNLGAGTYAVDVTDANTCTATRANIVLSNLSVVLTTANVKCFGAKDGQITVDITGGASPYTINVTLPNGTVQPFNSPANQLVIPGLDKGNYSVVVTDNNGTSVTKSATLTEPIQVAIALQNGTASLCAGATTGKIDVACNGGTLPYTITWVGDNAGVPVVGGALVGQSIINLAPARYVVTVTDAGGCAVTATHTIASNPALNLTVVSANPTCGNPISGTITLTAVGGNGAYTYTNDGITFNNATGKYVGLTAGAYKVAVIDGLGCQSAVQDVTLTAPSAINIAAVAKTDTKCAIGGTISVTAAGGGGALTYRLLRAGSKVLVTFNTTGQFDDVALGNYLIEVTDGGTCPATWPATIVIASGGGATKIKVINYTVDNIKCFGDKGKATIGISGVQGALSCVFVNRATGVTLTQGVDYTFSAIPGATAGDYTLEIGGFNSGNFNMFISDDNACPQKFPFGITGPTQLKFDLVTKVDPSSKTSANGSITAVVSGGVKPYNYSIDGVDFKNTTGIFTGLNPGKYTVTVKDKNHCIAVSSEVELVAQSNLNIDDIIVVNPKCHAELNGSIDIYASGGNGAMRYSIDNGVTFQDAHLFSNLKAGVYKVVVEDALGIRATQDITLADPEAVVVKVVRIKTPSADGAYDGSIVVIATGGSGTYVYSLVNANTGVELSNATTGSVELNFNKLPGGTYNIIATDENGCTGTVGPIVLEDLGLDVAVTDVKCSSDKVGKLDISVTGGVEPFKLTWQPKGGVVNGPFDVVSRKYSIDNLAPGDYVLAVTDATNSVYTTTATIKSPVALLASVSARPDTICAGMSNGKIDLKISGGKPDYTITWVAAIPNPTGAVGVVVGTAITGLHPSKYSITVTDANGCATVVDTAVASYPAIVIGKVEPVMPLCNGNDGSITVTASGGVGALKYSTTIAGVLTENTTGSFTNIKAGTYTISVTDTKGCMVKTTDVVITEPAAIVLTLTEVLDQSCTAKGKITTTATGGTGKLVFVTGALTNETGIFDNLDAGKYTITATDEAGCKAAVDAEVKSTATLKVKEVLVTDVVCNGGSTGAIAFKVEGAGAGLVVKVNDVEQTPDATGLYTVANLKAGVTTINVKDDSGCDISEQHNIVEPTIVTAAIKVTAVPLSVTDDGGKIEVVASGGSGFYTITCSDATTGTELSRLAIGEGIPAYFNKLLFGRYTITVTDDKGCSFTGDVTIANLAITAKGIGGSCKDPNGSIEVTITDGAKPYTVSYTKKGDAVIVETKKSDEGVVTFTGVDSGDYTVTVVDGSNVAVTADVTVPIYTAPTLTLVAKCFVNNDYYIEIGVPATLTKYTVTCTDAEGVAYTSYDPITHRITKLATNKTYSITVVDDLGCPSAVLSVDIATLPEMKVEDAIVRNVLCKGAATGSVELKATGGALPLKFSLTPINGTVNYQDSPVFTDRIAGKYVGITTDNAGCYSKVDLEITEPLTKLVFALDKTNSNTSVWCYSKAEGKLTFNVADAVPGYSVSLFDASSILVGTKELAAAGSVSFDLLKVGGYTAHATDLNGCSLSEVQNIEGTHIEPTLVLKDSECRRYIHPEDASKVEYGGAATITAIGKNFASDAVYYFKKGTGLLLEQIEPVVNPESDGYYRFTPGVSRKVSNLSGLTYSFIYKVVEARGTCEEDIPFSIGVKPENDYWADAKPDKIVCINSDVTFTADILGSVESKKQRYWIQWSNIPGSRVNVEYDRILEADFPDSFFKTEKITRSKLGKDKNWLNMKTPYVLRVESNNNLCYDVDTAFLSVHSYYDPQFKGPQIKSIDETGPYVYFVRIPIGGVQPLEMVKGSGDKFNREYKLTWNPLDAEWLAIDKTINEKVAVSDKFGENAALSGIITYMVNDKETCTETAGLVLNQMSTIKPPNAFTPNGDGYNDTWRVIYDEEMGDYPDLEVEVYNRLGSLVYHSKPYKNDWNGRYNGKDLPTGTYYYVIKLHRGNLPNIAGAVSILR